MILNLLDRPQIQSPEVMPPSPMIILFNNLMGELYALKELDEGCLVLSQENPLVHRMISSLHSILNSGLDNNSDVGCPVNMRKQPLPQASLNQLKLLVTLFVRFTSTTVLRFLKEFHSVFQRQISSKVKSGCFAKYQVLFVRYYEDGSITEFFRFLNTNNEYLNFYSPHSILRRHLKEIIQQLSYLYGILSESTVQDNQQSLNFKVEGNLVEKFEKYRSNEEYDEVALEFPVRNELNYNKSQSNIKVDLEFSRRHNSLFKSDEPENQFLITDDHASSQKNKDESMTMQNILDKPLFKPSKSLFQKHFENYLDLERYGKFHQKHPEISLSSQDYKCHNCGKNISKGFPLIKPSTAIRCQFSGLWYCPDCIHPEPMPIPYKAIKEFDLSRYPVSRNSFETINSIQDTPVLVLHYFEDIVFKDDTLHEFLLLRRQLHLLYDTCCQLPQFQLHPPTKMNIFITLNMFSLDDLHKIKSGELYKTILRIYKFGVKHMENCLECQGKRGSYCLGCKSEKKIYAFNILETQYCRVCKGLYHRECFPHSFQECNGCKFKQQ